MENGNVTEEDQEPYGEPDQDSLKYRIWECLRRWVSICCAI